MRLLITGGLGFIGSAVVRQAIATGHEVLNLDLETYAADRRNVASAETTDRYRHVRADICDHDAVARSLGDFEPNTVLHLAAESHVDRSIDGPSAFVQTNVVGTAVMLEETQQWLAANPDPDFRFVHVSTDEVFGSLGAGDDPFTPTTPYDPRSPYSSSKAAADHLARAWFHTYGLPVVVTNCSNNYGPYQFPEKLIPLMIIKALRREPAPVYGAGDNIRDWIQVEDHAAGLLAAATRGTPGSTYLFGGNAERSNLEVVRMICDLVDELVEHPVDGRVERRADRQDDRRRDLITFVADRPGHDHRYAVDYSGSVAGLGWQPSQTFEEGLRATVQWYLTHEEHWSPIVTERYSGQRLGVAS